MLSPEEMQMAISAGFDIDEDGILYMDGLPVISIAEPLAKYTSAIRANSVPDGYVLVPIEPTDEMANAGWEGFKNSDKPAPFNMLKDAYKAMIAATK